MYEKYLDKLVQKGDIETIKKVFKKAMKYFEGTDNEMYSALEGCLYESLYGKEINEEAAYKWVTNMSPIGEHWTMDEAHNAMMSNGYSHSKIEDYVVLNMIYNDYYDEVKNDDILAIKLADAWLSDDDAEEHKLYYYYKYIIK